MIFAVLFVAIVLAYLGLGWFVMDVFKPAPPARRVPKLELVRDERLDITRAFDRGRR